METCLSSIFILLGLISLGWIPIWIDSIRTKYQSETPAVILQTAAKLGLGALIMIGCLQVYSWGMHTLRYNDQSQIDHTYVRFRDYIIVDKDFEQAYLLMSSDYRKSHSLSEFIKDFGLEYMPPLVPNRLLSISVTKGTAKLYPEYDRYGDFWQSSTIFYWIKENGSWYLSGEVGIILD